MQPLEGRRLLAAHAGEHTMGVEVTQATVEPHHDSVPRFPADPSAMAVADGRWSDPSVWSANEVPDSDDSVVVPPGVSVLYDVNSQFRLDAIEVGGHLRFANDVDTSLWLNELMVMPTGKLTIGTEAEPIDEAVSATIVFTDTPDADGRHFKTGTADAPGVDPEQWGNGLLVFGSLEIHGQEKTASYARLAKEPMAGDDVLVFEDAPIGWQPGDQLVLPDTHSFWKHDRIEELTIASIDGDRVTLTRPLLHDHRGPRTTENDEPAFLPHIGNLSRNVVIKSENPQGVRGHVAAFARADVEIRYAQLKDLGRTANTTLDSTRLNEEGQVEHIGSNPSSRYSLHFHHVIGPPNPADTGFQFEAVGNAIDGALKWGVVLHGSHYGLVQNNIVYDYQGAGFVTEDGTESYNLFQGNFAIRSNGDGRGFKAGRAGEGFWFRGPLTRAVENVSANSHRTGFMYYVQNLHGLNRSTWPKPAFRGADMSQTSDIERYNVFDTGMLQFEGNEVYASAAVFDNWSSQPQRRQYLYGLTGWNTQDNHFSVSSYVNENLVIDGLRLVGDISGLNPEKLQKHQPISMVGVRAVRNSSEINIRDSEIRGVQTGFSTPNLASGEMLIADSVIQAYVGVHVGAMTVVRNAGPNPEYARLVIENTRFERMPENNADPDQYAIYMDFALKSDVTDTNEVFIYDFNGEPGADYRVYYPQQAPNFIVPQTSSSLKGAPDAGLTNAEAWAEYGLAIGGSVAPSREIDGDNGEAALARGRALGIHGLVFPIDAEAAQNEPPSVTAGPEMTVEQFRQVRLSGTVGDDGRPTGAASEEVHFDWSKRSGPGEVMFQDASRVDATVMFTEPGDYVMRLTASDGLRESYDDVAISVLIASNRAPIVRAGNDMVLDDTNVVTLTGTVLDDGNPGGTLVSEWSVVSGPGSVTLSDPSNLTTEATFTSQGEYTLQLSAHDGELTSTDLITVTVNKALPLAPLILRLEMDGEHGEDASLHGLHAAGDGLATVPGRWGNGIAFSGDGHLAVPRTSFLQPANGLTAAVWIRPAVTDGVFRPVLAWDGGSWDAYSLKVRNSPTNAELSLEISTVSNGKNRLSVNTASLPTDRWTHLALSYSQDNQGEMQIFRDGEPIAAKTGIGGPIVYKPHADRRLTIGRTNPGSVGPGFVGSMDDLYVYNDALTVEELSALMSGQPPHAPPHEASSMISVPPPRNVRPPRGLRVTGGDLEETISLPPTDEAFAALHPVTRDGGSPAPVGPPPLLSSELDRLDEETKTSVSALDDLLTTTLTFDGLE